jgi:Tol biopolymer transport system component
VRALPLLCLAVACVACGSRTALDAPLAVDGGSPVVRDAGPPVAFTPACSSQADDWILFDYTAGEGAIMAIRANGTDFRHLNLPHGPGFFPSVSPDGSMLLYAALPTAPPTTDGGVNSALYLYDLTTHVESLVVGTIDLTYSALSPDRQLVAYVSGYSLHSIRYDGTDDVTLLTGPDENGRGYGHPVFAADSVTVVYGGGGILGAIHADGTGNVTLVAEVGVYTYPNAAFSGDHTQIVAGTLCGSEAPFALSVFEYASLPAACASGTLLVGVDQSSSPNQANDPSWNPNGLIAYASDVDIFTIPATGGTPTNVTKALTKGGATASDPVWLPACATVP